MGIAMISILNGYNFKRNCDNVVLYSIESLACILGLQPYEIKEHYFLCVVDDCLAQGEYHLESIKNGELDLLLPVFNVAALIASLEREGFKIDEYQSKQVLVNMLETQSVITECFINAELRNNDYRDPIRKFNAPHVKDISQSISRKQADS